MKQVSSFKIFKKIIRKFYKRHCIKRIDHFNGKRFISFWEESDWIGYRVDSPEQLNNEKIYKYIRYMIGDEVMNRFDIVKNLQEKPKYLVHGEAGNLDLGDMEYCFDGIMLTNRDVYAILKLDDYKYKKYDYLFPIFKLINKKV